MMKRTHIAISLASTISIILNNPISILGVIGATAPDMDYKVGIKHRTLTHSLCALIISTVAIFIFNRMVSCVWFISYASHLIADSFTLSGVPFLYPFSKKCYGLRKIKTRSAEDYFIQIAAIIITLCTCA